MKTSLHLLIFLASFSADAFASPGATGSIPQQHPQKLEIFNGSGSGEYRDGENVNLIATVKEGYEFVRWYAVAGNGTLKNEEKEEATYIMGDDPAEVVAVLAKVSSWFPPGEEDGDEKVGLLLAKPKTGSATRLEQKIKVSIDRGKNPKPKLEDVWDKLGVHFEWKKSSFVKYFAHEKFGDAIESGSSDGIPKDKFKEIDEAYEGSIWYEGNLTQEQMAQQEGAQKVTTRLNLVIAGAKSPRFATGTLQPVEIKVYRPQEVQEAVTWNLTRKQKVIPDSEIEKKKIGIRVNKDGNDDGNENDLIEVEFASTVLEGFDLVIKRTSSKLKVFGSKDGTNLILDQTEAVVPGAMKPPRSYWVECTDELQSGEIEFIVRPKSGGQETKIQTLPFHSFKSAICALSGEVWGNPASAASQGIYKICEDLYLDGYNIHYFPESSEARSLAEIKDQRDKCSIQKVGIWGYSHGGGSTYTVAVALGQVAFTGYIDAISQPGAFSENRYPTGSVYHFNYYQRNWSITLPLRGDKTKPRRANIEEDLTSTTDHLSIDDDTTVATDLKAAIKAQITP